MGLSELLRRAEGPPFRPTAAVFDRATPQCTRESKRRASYCGHKKRQGSIAFHTRSRLLALLVMSADAAEDLIRLDAVKLSAAEHGFTLPSRQ
jgi:hypothetical protein